MRNSLLFLILIISHFSYSQDFFFKASGELVSSIDQADSYIQLVAKKKRIDLTEYRIENGKKVKITSVKKAKMVSDSVIEIKRYVNGNLLSAKNRVFVKLSDSTFLVKEYYKDGGLSYQGVCKNHFPLIKHGESTQYYSNQLIRSKEIHDNNKLISSACTKTPPTQVK